MKLFFKKSKIKERELIGFTRQLGLVLKAKLPLLMALEVILKENTNATLGEILKHLIESVRSGYMLSAGMKHYPAVFDEVYINIIRSGEESSLLSVVLLELADYRQQLLGIKRKVKSAMLYPMIVFSIVICVTSILLVFVVPRFAEMFKNMLGGQSLPVLTQILLGLGKWFQANFYWAGLLFAGLLFILRILNKNHVFSSLWLKIPIAKKWILKAVLGQFSRTLSMLLRGGLPVCDALKVVKSTIPNRRIASSIEALSGRLLAGDSLIASFSKDPIFPPLLISMVKIGEETSTLAQMLESVADTYSEDIDFLAKDVTKLIEPILILVLAIMIGVVVFALFLPIMTLIEQLMI